MRKNLWKNISKTWENFLQNSAKNYTPKNAVLPKMGKLPIVREPLH